MTWTVIERTSTTLRSVDTSLASALEATASSAKKAAATATVTKDLIDASRAFRGASQSLAIISAEKVTATATDSNVAAEATQAIYNSTINLMELAREESLYTFNLSRPANIIYLAVFFLLFIYFIFMAFKSRYHWFNITFVCGYGLEFIGFLGRVLGFIDNTNTNYFLMGYVSLTISPAFIMAGVYFLFAQLAVVTNAKYSALRPMWYSYLFITCDVLSLLIQAAGGAMASRATVMNTSPKPGTHTMIAGIAFQVVAMTVFVILWLVFLFRLFFADAKNIQVDSPYKKKSKFFPMFFNTKDARTWKLNELDSYYNPNYTSVRGRKLFSFYPFAITAAVLLIYIRCVYRVVELSQGWRGYLISREVFLMVLDALMISLAGLIFVPFHPYWVFGPIVLKVSEVRKAGKKNKQDKDITVPGSELDSQEEKL